MNTSQKGFASIVLIIALVVILAGGVGYFELTKKTDTPATATTTEQATSQTPQTPATKTAGWKTYRDDKFSFEFKYPPDLRFEQQSGLDPSINENWVTVTLKNDSDFSLSFFVGTRPTGAPGEGYDNPKLKKIIVADKQVDEALYLPEQESENALLTIWTQHSPDRADFFHSYFKKSQVDVFVPRIESIVGTLRYTDTKQEPVLLDNSRTYSTHSTIKAYLHGPSEIATNTVWKGSVVIPQNTVGIANAPDVMWGDGAADPEFGGSPWQYDSVGNAPITHTYTKPGSYTITVYINGSGGAGFEQGTVVIKKTVIVRQATESNNRGAANFSASPISGQAPLMVKFTGLFGETIEFGDGETSKAIYICTGSKEEQKCSFSVDHTYAIANTYTAKLVEYRGSCELCLDRVPYTIGTTTITVL